MLFGNFIKKKIAQAVIEEAIKALPELKEKALEEIKLRGAEFLNDVFDTIKAAVIDFIKKRFGK